MSDYYRKFYGQQRNQSFVGDPCPVGGLNEDLYCGLKARYGSWPEAFMKLVASHYSGRIPPRFTRLADRLARERPWEDGAEAFEFTGLPPTITIVDREGRIVDRWRPSKQEWEASKPHATSAETTTKDPGSGHR